MRGDQLARQWRIIRAIESAKAGLTVSELAKSEDVSLRTIYRDIEALSDAGFPLYTEKADRANKWFFVDTYKFKVPPPFTLSELMSLWLYRDFLKVFKDTVFYDSLESVFKKVQVTLPPNTLSYLDRIQSSFSVGIKPYKEYGEYAEILNQVDRAVVDRKRIEIAYTPLRTDKETLRKIDPYKIWFFDGTLYLLAHCNLRGEVRMFVLERMKLVNVTNENFDISEDFDFEEYMRHSFKVMHDELHKVKIRISPEWARWVGEKIWHESQKKTQFEDGSLEIIFEVAGLEEIKRWLLSLGQHAVVIEPQALRDEIQIELLETAALYDRNEAYRRLREKLRV